MKRINSLSDLLMEEMADLLDVENQMIKVLPKMAKSSRSEALKAALEDYREITKEHAVRLQDIFSNIGQDPPRVTGHVMKGLIAESEDIEGNTQEPSTRDVAIISVVQRAEEYEISGYKTAREHAADLGHTRIVEIFTKTLNEERAMNFHLNELAQGMINAQVIEPKDSHEPSSQQMPGPSSKPKGGGFYMPEGKFGRKGVKKKSNTDVSRYISEGNPNTDGTS